MILIFIFLFLFSCNNIKNNQNIVSKYPEDQKYKRISKNGYIFDEKKISFKMTENKENKLFQKSISIVSNYLPILIIDEKNSFISSDWGNLKELSKNNNLYKINIYIKNNNPEITVFEKNSKDVTSKNETIKNKIKELIIKE